ncbi:HK97 family phage prohead protease [Zavarzinella formosa]|uniref:HK97 family phage prohead protease n=1 Tax=Zavarzinella formosa TaxID=360055 RepID=UPI00030C9F94|nr:HK97 family phage prohead protease [Zavarzinella formosa]
MKIRHKSFSLHELKTDDEARTVEGWASTFGNKDAGDDIILSGAFTASLAVRKPKMLWQHDTGELIGMWDAATETEKGLYVKGRFADTPRGNEAYTLAKMGALDSMSIGYSTLDYDYDPKTGTRTLKKLDLWEVSLVTFPMNEQATITTVKSAAEDIDAAYDLLEQATGICDAYASGEMEPTAEMLGTVAQLARQAMSLLGDDDADEPEDDTGKSRPSPKSIERFLREAGLSRSDAKGLLAKGYTAITPRREAVGDSELTAFFNQFKL